jgi:hypothetical protein
MEQKLFDALISSFGTIEVSEENPAIKKYIYTKKLRKSNIQKFEDGWVNLSDPNRYKIKRN